MYVVRKQPYISLPENQNSAKQWPLDNNDQWGMGSGQ